MNTANENPVIRQTLDGVPVNASAQAGYTPDQVAGMERRDTERAKYGLGPQPGGRFVQTATFVPHPCCPACGQTLPVKP